MFGAQHARRSRRRHRRGSGRLRNHAQFSLYTLPAMQDGGWLRRWRPTHMIGISRRNPELRQLCLCLAGAADHRVAARSYPLLQYRVDDLRSGRHPGRLVVLVLVRTDRKNGMNCRRNSKSYRAEKMPVEERTRKGSNRRSQPGEYFTLVIWRKPARLQVAKGREDSPTN